MSLVDLQDVCIDVGSLATLDLPMVVDLIGIYVLKGPYSSPPPPPCAAVCRRRPPSAARFVIGLVSITTTSLKCRFPRETGRSQAPRRQQGFPGYSAGRGVDPAGGSPGGG
ncbi:hypothetical protein F511_20690 [Dorcoceras hygrometricum]|uniref:Uncharacterized protein n=1 Tax=Dorcoceras hygrometricum TaxID=472368 RepID=A0A2Z7CS75_9LAMI|nr:hypothetical protein F511_20690 [Dorcoceras hygrometricum]